MYFSTIRGNDMTTTVSAVKSRLAGRGREAMRKLRELKQRGYSMIEIAIAVVIIGAVLAVTVIYVRSVLSDNKVNDELKELPLVVTRIQKMYSNAPTYEGISTATVARANVYPQERVDLSDNSIKNRWNGAVTVESPSPYNLAELEYTGMTRNECLGIVTQLDSVMDVIVVGGTTVKASGSPTDITEVGEACVDNVTVQYRFRK